MKRVLVVLFVIVFATVAFAQTTSSSKAFYSYRNNTDAVIVGGQTAQGFAIGSGALKTSSVGSILMGLSMECAIWTNTQTKATKGGGTVTNASGAKVAGYIVVDRGTPYEYTTPQITFCDRWQQVSLTFGSDTVLATDYVTLDLFQKTKNANHFNFYFKNNVGSAYTHTVEAFAILDAYDAANTGTDATNTRAIVGQTALVLEEYNKASTN